MRVRERGGKGAGSFGREMAAGGGKAGGGAEAGGKASGEAGSKAGGEARGEAGGEASGEAWLGSHQWLSTRRAAHHDESSMRP